MDIFGIAFTGADLVIIGVGMALVMARLVAPLTPWKGDDRALAAIEALAEDLGVSPDRVAARAKVKLRAKARTRLRDLSSVVLVLVLAGCAKVSELTDTTFAERCLVYQTALKAARAMPASDARQERIAIYEALVAPCYRQGVVSDDREGGSTAAGS